MCEPSRFQRDLRLGCLFAPPAPNCPSASPARTRSSVSGSNQLSARRNVPEKCRLNLSARCAQHVEQPAITRAVGDLGVFARVLVEVEDEGEGEGHSGIIKSQIPKAKCQTPSRRSLIEMPGNLLIHRGVQIGHPAFGPEVLLCIRV